MINICSLGIFFHQNCSGTKTNFLWFQVWLPKESLLRARLWKKVDFFPTYCCMLGENHYINEYCTVISIVSKQFSNSPLLAAPTWHCRISAILVELLTVHNTTVLYLALSKYCVQAVEQLSTVSSTNLIFQDFSNSSWIIDSSQHNCSVVSKESTIWSSPELLHR